MLRPPTGDLQLLLALLLLLLATLLLPMLPAAAGDEEMSLHMSVSPASVQLGGSSRLSCQLLPSPATYIFWSFSSDGDSWQTLGLCHVGSGVCNLKEAFSSWLPGVSLSPDGGLSVGNVSRRQDGAYQCEAVRHTQSVRDARSLTVVTQPQAPSISASASSAVAAGQSLNATCSSAGGNPSPQLLWLLRRSGETQYRPLPATAARLLPAAKFAPTVSSVGFVVAPEDHRASLLCSVVHPLANLSSSPVLLSVLYAPRMASPPSVVGVAGEAATLGCSGDGNPAPAVRFERNGRRVSAVALGRVSWKLGNLTQSDAGNYSCVGSSDAGNGSSSTRLEVQLAPLVSAPALAAVREGAELSVDCSVRALPAPLWIRWRRVDDRRPGANSSALLLRPAGRADAGQWRCEAANRLTPSGGPSRLATASATTLVVVQYAPGQPVAGASSRRVLAGDSVSLVCDPSAVSPGVPAPTFAWRHEPSGALSAGQRLALAPVRLLDSGRYSCTPSNSVGQGPAAFVTLSVEQQPKWTQRLPEETVADISDKSFELRCSVGASPLAELKWFKDSQILDSRLYTVVTQSDPASHTSNSTLRFRGSKRRSLLPQDNGKYLCSAQNTRGKVSQSTQLVVKFAPIILTTVKKVALDPEASGASLECPLLSLPEPTVTWEFSDASRLGNLVPDSATPYRYRATMLGIRQVGQYTCSVRNELGSARHTFSVVRQSVPDAPGQLAVVANAWDHVLLEWQPNFDGGHPASYWVTHLAGGQASDSFSLKPAGSGRDLNVTGLLPDTNYTFRVYAANRLGRSPDSSALSVTTDSLAMPTVSNVYRSGEELLFASLPNYCLRVEVSKVEPAAWSLLHRCLPSGRGRVANINFSYSYRLSLCLPDRESICGQPVSTQLLSGFPEVSSATIAIVASSCALLIVALGSVLLFFCCRGRGQPASDSGRQRSKQSSLDQDVAACTYKSYHSKPYALVSPHPSLTSTDETTIEPTGKVFTTLLSASHPLPGNNHDGSGSDNSGTFLHPSRQRKVIYEVVV